MFWRARAGECDKGPNSVAWIEASGPVNVWTEGDLVMIVPRAASAGDIAIRLAAHSKPFIPGSSESGIYEPLDLPVRLGAATTRDDRPTDGVPLTIRGVYGDAPHFAEGDTVTLHLEHDQTYTGFKWFITNDAASPLDEECRADPLGVGCDAGDSLRVRVMRTGEILGFVMHGGYVDSGGRSAGLAFALAPDSLRASAQH